MKDRRMTIHILRSYLGYMREWITTCSDGLIEETNYLIGRYEEMCDDPKNIDEVVFGLTVMNEGMIKRDPNVKTLDFFLAEILSKIRENKIDKLIEDDGMAG